MPKIEQIYAFIAEDEDEDDEGVVATDVMGMMMPLIAADRDRVDSLRQIAADIVVKTNKPIKLVVFTNRADVEQIFPPGSGG